MSYFRGRPLNWDPDRHIIEQERQQWVYEKLESLNDLTIESTRDPDQEYRAHRQAYEETGDLAQLRLALEYVRQ